MLRWTCRLRNVLERRDHVETFPGPLPEIREAEFVSSGSGTFPDEFRWDTFQVDVPFIWIAALLGPLAPCFGRNIYVSLQASSIFYGFLRPSSFADNVLL
jgi:hypothetical protein